MTAGALVCGIDGLLNQNTAFICSSTRVDMSLENLVCDRELAEKLKSLGYPQESVFWWVVDQEKEYLLYHYEQVRVYEGDPTHLIEEIKYALPP